MAVVATLRERSLHQPIEARIHVRPPGGDRRSRRAHLHPADRVGVVREERHRSRRELVQHDPARVDVAACVELLTEALLRGHVDGRPCEALRNLSGHARRYGEAEVEDLHRLDTLAVVVVLRDDHHVVRLHVAVDETTAVSMPEPRTDLQHQRRYPRHVEDLLALLDRSERGAVDERHREIEEAVGLLAEVVDVNQVRVIETRERERLGIEATTELDVALERLVEDLHRDRDAEAEVTGAIDGADAAFAEHREDLDAPARDHAPDELVRRHRTFEQRRGGLALLFLVGVEPERATMLARRAERLREQPKRGARSRRVHLEDVRSRPCRLVFEPNPHRTPEERRFLQLTRSLLFEESCDENWQRLSHPRPRSHPRCDRSSADGRRRSLHPLASSAGEETGNRKGQVKRGTGTLPTVGRAIRAHRPQGNGRALARPVPRSTCRFPVPCSG